MKHVIVLVMALMCIAVNAIADVPQVLNYQGRLTDTGGSPVDDGSYLIKFIIYDNAVDGTELWNSGYQTIALSGGIFHVELGASPMSPLPYDLFRMDTLRYLGVTIGVDQEISPRTKLVSAPYAYQSSSADIALTAIAADTADYARSAERVIRSRDLYHQIIDINANSTTTIPFVTRNDSAAIILYLYGSGYQGTIAQHTHDGNNEHTHGVSGTIGSTSVSHTHAFSGTTGSGGQSHTHSGTTSSYNLAHSHPGTTSSYNLAHSHSGNTDTDGHHHHDFLFTGALDGLFLVHNGDYNGLTAHGSVQLHKATGSVSTSPSDHSHHFSTSSWGGNHNHTFTTGSWGGNHNHSITTGNASTSHTHSFSGSTGSHNISHSHSFTGTVGSAGSGLGVTGMALGILPTGVSVYVDGYLAAGPFDGEFASGQLDLSSYITTAGEHTIEIVEDGGTGGRLTYNLFVE